MTKTVLWIDDSTEEREKGAKLLAGIQGVVPVVASSSTDARRILEAGQVDAIVTDILRRHSEALVAETDGYQFFLEYIRPAYPKIPVVFHTKNLLESFETDEYSHYLSKWEPVAKKEVELEARLADVISLYEACADLTTWNQIEPRLVTLNTRLLAELRHVDDVWMLTPEKFEQLVGEILSELGYKVLWIPGGKDGGIDIVASSRERDFLIDVKRYRTTNPVTVELVRGVYGVAESVAPDRPGRIVHGGIITSSRFTADAEEFRRTLRRRPLLRDGQWLREQLEEHSLRLRK